VNGEDPDGILFFDYILDRTEPRNATTTPYAAADCRPPLTRLHIHERQFRDAHRTQGGQGRRRGAREFERGLLATPVCSSMYCLALPSYGLPAMGLRTERPIDDDAIALLLYLSA
jgi:hypothetical protein